YGLQLRSNPPRRMKPVAGLKIDRASIKSMSPSCNETQAVSRRGCSEAGRERFANRTAIPKILHNELRGRDDSRRAICDLELRQFHQLAEGSMTRLILVSLAVALLPGQARSDIKTTELVRVTGTLVLPKGETLPQGAKVSVKIY